MMKWLTETEITTYVKKYLVLQAERKAIVEWMAA